MARRPYLENERFWNLPEAALLYIARDAREAAEAMKGHNERAEGKYLDQMNDALTVLAYRRKH
jgi:hypothetical protein